MAFNLSSWSRLSPSANQRISTLQNGALTGAPAVFSYVTADTQATVAGADYFGSLAAELNLGDLIYVSAVDSKKLYEVTALTVDTQSVTIVSGALTPGSISSVSGTANRITVTAGADPVVNIDPNYVGQNTLTTLGTVTTGVWNGTPVAAAYTVTPGRLTSVQVLTSGTAATYNKPAGITTLLVELIGGGGGGGGSTCAVGEGGAGGGGGSGAYCSKLIVGAANTYTYTVGAGGAGGAAGNNNGAVGGDTTFGALTAGGGLFGFGSASSAGSGEYSTARAGGTASGGDVNVNGAPGGPGSVCVGSGAGLSIGGYGGNSVLGGAGPQVTVAGNATNGNNAIANSGSGGSGGCAGNTASTAAGGNGGSGRIIVWEFS